MVDICRDTEGKHIRQGTGGDRSCCPERKIISYLCIMEKVYADPELGKVLLRKRAGVKRVSLRVSREKGIRMTLPFWVSYDQAIRFYISRRQWVQDTLEKLKDAPVPKQLSKDELKSLSHDAAAYLPERLEFLASQYGFTYSSLRLKFNRTNWGSCSTRKNINLNICLMNLPPLMRDYVMLHELCHLHHPDHSESFHALLENLLTRHIIQYLGITDESGGKITSELCNQDSAFVRELIPMIRKSRAKFPTEHSISTLIRKYRPDK